MGGIGDRAYTYTPVHCTSVHCTTVYASYGFVVSPYSVRVYVEAGQPPLP